MKLIPILFSTPMVQAILNGNKSMTRRIVKPNPRVSSNYDEVGKLINEYSIFNLCPYGQPGDVLWVREKFCNINFPEIDPEYYFFTQALDAEDYDPKEWKWKPGIHMPFEACRIFLRVKEIRVERLQDITAADITREGVVSSFTNPKMGIRHENAISMEFERLWISINGKDSWNSNPWVWVVSFERITNISEIVDIVELWNERRAK